MARERDITLEEFNHEAETDPMVDKQLDACMREAVNENPKRILVSRTAAHLFSQESWSMIKIFLKVDPDVGAERIFNNRAGRSNEARNFSTLAEIKSSLETRQHKDVERYKRVYGIIITDESVFDKVIDTTAKSIKVVNEEVLKYIKRHMLLSA